MVAVLGASTLALQPAHADSTITLWHIQSTGTGPKLIQDAVDRFEAANPGVKVEVSPIANDAYKDKIKVALGANAAPCIFPSWGGGPLAAYVKAGQVIDLTSQVTANNYKAYFLPAAWSNVTFNNKIYGVPVENSSIAVIWYSKSIFAKNKLTPPKTWNDLLKVVRALNHAGVAPFALGGGSKWPEIMWYDYLVDRLGGAKAFNAAALRTGGKFTDSAFIRAGQYLQTLVKDKAFIKGYNGIIYDNGAPRQLIEAGKAAMELMGSWEYSGFLGDKKADDIGFFPFPSIPGGQGDQTDVLGTVGDNFYSISSTCADKADAFKVIQYLIDDTSVKARVADGRIPPVAGVTLTDPNNINIYNLLTKAHGVQLWWDQYLPPDLAQLHLNETQALFGLTETPQAMAAKQEALATKLLGVSKKS